MRHALFYFNEKENNVIGYFKNHVIVADEDGGLAEFLDNIQQNTLISIDLGSEYSE